MKKLVVLLLALVVVCVGVLAACGSNEAKVKVIEIQLTDEDYAIAVDKNDTSGLLASINTIVAEIKNDGTLQSIIDKHALDSADKTGYTPVSTVPAKAADKLIMVTNAAFPPFEYREGDKCYGIDIDIAGAIATKLNRTLVVVDMEFDAALTSVSQHQADIMIAGLTVSDPRKEIVNFSDSYYKSNQVLIVRADDTTFDNCKTVAEVEAALKGLTGKKIGFQNATTGEYYAKGDTDWGFDGFSNLTAKGFTTGALAAQDLVNKNIDVVVLDEMPAKSIAASMNGKK